MWAFWRHCGGFGKHILRCQRGKVENSKVGRSSSPWQHFCAPVLTWELPYLGFVNWDNKSLIEATISCVFVFHTEIIPIVLWHTPEVYSSSKDVGGTQLLLVAARRGFFKGQESRFFYELLIFKCWLKLKKYMQAKQNTYGGQVHPKGWQFSTPELPQRVVRTKLNEFKIRSLIIVANTHTVLTMFQARFCWLSQSSPQM